MSTVAGADNYSDRVRTEADSYFRRIFQDPSATDSVVENLARFKESSDKREQSVLDCVITNLFGEYKYFSEYPEKQLKTVAILFGSLIKHQIVTNIQLGIALRVVLDALKKPSNSQMFVFGTMALEQFVDRLAEWPVYRNHVLRKSHLRDGHPFLSAFIERTAYTENFEWKSYRVWMSSRVARDSGTSLPEEECLMKESGEDQL